jgi:leader peptidase (prepilin peptidase)/N-methyltransferase
MNAHAPILVLSAWIPALSALFGALVGSFLNVCIYRLPLDLSVRTPSRSFCPSCKRTLPWWENIPILSWLLLRARCAGCKTPIPCRYPLVEALTAFLFWGASVQLHSQPLLVLLPVFTLVSLLIVATFIDIEHMIIPNEITWGGVGAALLFSLLIPALHGVSSPLQGLAQSLLGAALGYGLLWAIAELGHLLLGKKRVSFPEPTPTLWTRKGEEADLQIGEETTAWGDFFFRGSEEVHMGILSGEIDGRELTESEAVWTLNQLRIETEIETETEEQTVVQTFDLNQTDRVRLQIMWLVFPREAMGFGDVKFLAAIGAFLGWKAVLFTLMAGCSAGALIGSLLKLSKKNAGAIPFGPYLAFGALLWIAAGPAMVQAYWQWVTHAAHIPPLPLSLPALLP